MLYEGYVWNKNVSIQSIPNNTRSDSLPMLQSKSNIEASQMKPVCVLNTW